MRIGILGIKTPREGRKKYVQTCALLCPWTEGAHETFQLSLSTLVTSVSAPLMGRTLLPIIMKLTTNLMNKDKGDEDKDLESVKLPSLVVLHRGAETQNMFSMNHPFLPENGRTSANVGVAGTFQREKALGLKSISFSHTEPQ